MTACVVAVSAAVIYRLLVAPEPGPVSRSLARGDWSELVVSGTHYGPKDAPVRVVVFVDYECPFCRGFHEALENVMREPGAQFSVSVHDLPLRMHASAVRSAAIAYCTRHVLPYAEVATTLYYGKTQPIIRSRSRAFSSRSHKMNVTGSSAVSPIGKLEDSPIRPAQWRRS